MPAHSSYILQPLDVGCFNTLKKAYGRKIEDIIQTHIIHIIKDDLFPAFREVHFAAMTKSNIRGGSEVLDFVHLTLKESFLCLISSYIHQCLKVRVLVPLNPRSLRHQIT
jgi:hypothetical protein